MKQSIAVRHITARLKGHSIPPFHVVFEKWQVTFKNHSTEPTKVATVGVWIDLTQLSELAVKAATNRSRKSRDGALNVELHFIEEVKG
jgi:hypothetical protein